MLRAEELGMSAAVYDFPSGTEDFSAILTRAKNRGACCVLCCGGMEDDINLAIWVSKNSAHGFGVVATLAAAVNEFEKRLGREADGFVSTSQWEPTFSVSVDFGPSPREFSDKFASAYGYVPDYTAAQSYNMGLIIEKLIEKTGGTDEQALLREALRSEFTTFLRRFPYRPRHPPSDRTPNVGNPVAGWGEKNSFSSRIFEFPTDSLRGGGADGVRTHDLMNAIHALSQLSYGPTKNRIINLVSRQVHVKP